MKVLAVAVLLVPMMCGAQDSAEQIKNAGWTFSEKQDAMTDAKECQLTSLSSKVAIGLSDNNIYVAVPKGMTFGNTSLLQTRVDSLPARDSMLKMITAKIGKFADEADIKALVKELRTGSTLRVRTMCMQKLCDDLIPLGDFPPKYAQFLRCMEKR